MNRKILLLLPALLYSQIVFADNTAIKEAFSAGIKASVEVMNYEQKQLSSPLKDAYCLSVSTHDHLLHAWEAVKLESLGLLLGYKPAFFIQTDTDASSRSLLCLSVRESKRGIQEDLMQTLKQYPKLTDYTTGIVFLPKDSHWRRAVPGVQMTWRAAQVDNTMAKTHPILTSKPVKKETVQQTKHIVRKKTIKHSIKPKRETINTSKTAVSGQGQSKYTKPKETRAKPAKIIYEHDGIIVSKTPLQEIYTITQKGSNEENGSMHKTVPSKKQTQQKISQVSPAKIVYDYNGTIVTKTALKDIYTVAHISKTGDK